MRSVNKIILIGNLTRDPEMRQTPNGQNVTTFGLATNREWVTQTGERKNSAEFHECVAWAKLAEICNQYIKKGNLVYVEGYLKTRNWEAEDGSKRFKTEIVVQDMIILEKRKGGEETEENYASAESQSEGQSESQSESPKEEKTESLDSPSEDSETSEEKPEDKKNTNLIDQDLGL